MDVPALSDSDFSANVKYESQRASLESVVAANKAVAFFNAYIVRDTFFKGRRIEVAAAGPPSEEVTFADVGTAKNPGARRRA